MHWRQVFEIRFSPKRMLGLLALFIALMATPLLLNQESRDVILSRLSRKSVEQRLKAIDAVKPWIAKEAGRIQGGLAILVFKSERVVELHAKGWDEPRIYIMTGFNGKLGPKLREGDGQIPEGIYDVESLNPNSAFHLSLKVSYPNATDMRHAQEDGRSNLGGDIMIHGGSATVGCIPIGDDAVEEVFYFAAKAVAKKTAIIIAPYDMRKGRIAEKEQSTLAWYGTLCDEIAAALKPFNP